MENIPIWILLTITLAAQTIQTLLRRVYCNRVSNTNSGYNILNAVLSAVCALTLAACSGFNLQCSNYTLISAIIFGVITALGCVFSLVATGIGPLSYTTVIISSSTVITALSGCIFWHEQIKITQIIGIALMIGCLVCSVKKDDGKTKTSLKWLLMCLIAMLFSGGVGIMQKIHQTSEHANELYAFLVIAFEISTVASLITLAFSIKRDKGRVFVNKRRLRIENLPDDGDSGSGKRNLRRRMQRHKPVFVRENAVCGFIPDIKRRQPCHRCGRFHDHFP